LCRALFTFEGARKYSYISARFSLFCDENWCLGTRSAGKSDLFVTMAKILRKIGCVPLEGRRAEKVGDQLTLWPDRRSPDLRPCEA